MAICKPILFSTPMIQAILDGRKTMTRRVIKPQPDSHDSYESLSDDVAITKRINMATNTRRLCPDCMPHFATTESRSFPFTSGPWEVRNVLWVRETWAEMPYGYVYRADYDEENDDEPEGWDPDERWKPSIFMPKEACRTFLRVTGVRVERLQEISSADAKAEGILPGEEWPFDDTPREMFAYLWDEINAKRNGGAYSWARNPWVWVVQFERTEKPEGWPVA